MCITILPSFCQAIVIFFDKEAFILVQYFDPEQPFVGCTDYVLHESFWPKGNEAITQSRLHCEPHAWEPRQGCFRPWVPTSYLPNTRSGTAVIPVWMPPLMMAILHRLPIAVQQFYLQILGLSFCGCLCLWRFPQKPSYQFNSFICKFFSFIQCRKTLKQWHIPLQSHFPACLDPQLSLCGSIIRLERAGKRKLEADSTPSLKVYFYL